MLQLFFNFGQSHERIDQIFYIHFINQTAVSILIFHHIKTGISWRVGDRDFTSICSVIGKCKFRVAFVCIFFQTALACHTCRCPVECGESITVCFLIIHIVSGHGLCLFFVCVLAVRICISLSLYALTHLHYFYSHNPIQRISGSLIGHIQMIQITDRHRINRCFPVIKCFSVQ